jgi:hypothetical protein
MARKTTDLPGIEGEGVSAVHIPEIDQLAEAYVKERDRRLKLTPKEVAAKLKLIDAMHAHAKKLTLPDGTLTYRYDEMVITLEMGKEKLKVRDVSHDAEEEE